MSHPMAFLHLKKYVYIYFTYLFFTFPEPMQEVPTFGSPL